MYKRLKCVYNHNINSFEGVFIMSKNKTKNVEKKFTKKEWTPQENDNLFNAVSNKGDLSLTDVFTNLSKQTGRPAGSISQHYYSMLKKNSTSQVDAKVSKKKNDKTLVENKDKDALIQKIELMSPRALKSLSFLVGCMLF